MNLRADHPPIAAGVLLLLGAFLVASCDRRAAAIPEPARIAPPLVPMTNMVLIKPGTFTRQKQHVTLSRDYWIAQHEVTQAEFAALRGTNPSYFAGDLRPVERVSQVEASAYCAALTQRERQSGHISSNFEYRLPTEAEWEYACRSSSTNLFSFGDDTAEAGAYAWTQENSDGTTHPVGEKRPNAWGLYDMHGNVWEWCLDWFSPFPTNHVTDPRGPAQGKFKVFRGGGWNNEIQYARAVNRFMMTPSNGIHFVGFRVALAPVAPVSVPRRTP